MSSKKSLLVVGVNLVFHCAKFFVENNTGSLPLVFSKDLDHFFSESWGTINHGKNTSSSSIRTKGVTSRFLFYLIVSEGHDRAEDVRACSEDCSTLDTLGSIGSSNHLPDSAALEVEVL